MADIVEQRTQASVTYELRDVDSTEPVLDGYASTFMQPYDMGAFSEQIHPDAFKRSLANKAEVPLLREHQGAPLANTKSGTMKLSTDSTGLHVLARLDMANPETQALVSSMRRGDLDKMSFAFRVPANGDEWSNNLAMRTINEANIHKGDVSVVTYPANDTAEASVRSIYVDAVMREHRAGAALSAATVAKLKDILDMVARADDNVDQAQADLADVLGVANPDKDDPATPGEPVQSNSGRLELSRRIAVALSL